MAGSAATASSPCRQASHLSLEQLLLAQPLRQGRACWSPAAGGGGSRSAEWLKAAGTPRWARQQDLPQGAVPSAAPAACGPGRCPFVGSARRQSWCVAAGHGHGRQDCWPSPGAAGAGTVASEQTSGCATSAWRRPAGNASAQPWGCARTAPALPAPPARPYWSPQPPQGAAPSVPAPVRLCCSTPQL